MKQHPLWLIGILFCSTLAAQAADGKRDVKAEIGRALSAMPASLSDGAAVVAMDDKGQIRELRRGSNGWTCLPHDPGTPQGHPLCLDANGLEWMVAAMQGRIPDPDKIGYSYMLQGGTSWSNTDVTAMSLPPGQKDYVRIPPHFMIMNARLANSSGYPSGEVYPDTHKPFVIYGGTPYAILMIPLE